jgi:hypothetical protein
VAADAIRVSAGGQPVLVSQPDGTHDGSLSVDLAVIYARARRERAVACVLPPNPNAANPALLSLVPSGVPVHSTAGPWIRARWWGRRTARQASRKVAGARASFWLEWHKELRRHIGDERLPVDLRGRMRDSAHRSLIRSNDWHRTVPPFPRRWLREKTPISLPPALVAEAAASAKAAGIDPDRPWVAMEIRRRPEVFADAIAWLERQGYAVVPIGKKHPSLVELYALLMARFLVCESLDVQHRAYLTNTPSLLLNARDPFSAYPVRDDGLFTLATPVDLESGAAIAGSDLDERYFRSLRSCGFRGNSSAQILAAVQEIHGLVTTGGRESAAQTAFRERVMTAATSQAGRFALVAKWGPDAGFLGNGRLAQWQAEVW